MKVIVKSLYFLKFGRLLLSSKCIFEIKGITMSKTIIFGHRGYPAKFAENSLEGFEYVIHHGGEGIEFDVHLTKDGVPVIMHDEDIKRTTNGQGLIKDMTYQELEQYHLANGEKIPRLIDLFKMIEGFDGFINLEMKTNKFDYPYLPEKIFAMAENFNFKHDLIYSSFNLETLRHAVEINPQENYDFLTKKKIKNPEEFIKENGLSGIHPHRLLKSTVAQRVWTVDRHWKAKRLIKAGAGGIFTNNFEDMIALRDELQVN